MRPSRHTQRCVSAARCHGRTATSAERRTNKYYALVFMVDYVATGTRLSRSLARGLTARLILAVIVSLTDINIRLWVITMDGHPTDVTMRSRLGCNLRKRRNRRNTEIIVELRVTAFLVRIRTTIGRCV